MEVKYSAKDLKLIIQTYYEIKILMLDPQNKT